jgi:hypothetical protein
MKQILVLTVALMLSACAVGGHIIQLDTNSYTLTEVDMKLGFGPVRSGIVDDVYKQANDYCAKVNKEAKRLSHSQKDAAIGSPASFTLEFTCVEIGN